jgi:bifunctional non-homologous end joining protein LigD
MGLVEYHRKRSSTRSPEPRGGKPTGSKLRFTVQKHAASSLHYDFRLELDGVLKSWAVPKGPSLNPTDKRLALQVEDHPFDYKDFEGVIPEGNYGAGTVMLWDRGTYESLEPVKGKSEHEQVIRRGLRKGMLKFRLRGKKLKGEFVLVKTSTRAPNTWLLIKHRDEHASAEPIPEGADLSVQSGKTLEEIGKREKRASRTRSQT